MEYLSKSEKETYVLAASLAKDFQGSEVLALFGDLGSGKTTFAKGVAKALGITKTLTSPTFNILKIYPLSHSKIKRLIHIDAYRLSGSDDAIEIGLAEMLNDKSNIFLIEWPENVWPIIKGVAIPIEFSFVDEMTRKIVIKERFEIDN